MNWRESLELQVRGGCAGSLWYRASNQVPQFTERLSRSFDRFANSKDQLAADALGLVLNRWVMPDAKSTKHARFPILLENRIEILCQAAEQLKLTQ